MYSQNPHLTDQEQNPCDPQDIRTHDWAIWTLYFLKCRSCGQHTPRDSFKLRALEAQEADEPDRQEASYGK